MIPEKSLILMWINFLNAALVDAFQKATGLLRNQAEIASQYVSF
jgi:hypothetical protein